VTNRTGILLALLLSLAGCATPVMVSDSIRLKEDEGIIVYRMSCGPGIAWGQVFPSGENSKGYLAEFNRAGMLLCPDGMQTQRLRAGHYFVGKIGYEGVIDFSEQDAMQFDVAAGKLNYIGHIKLPSSVEKKNGRRLVLISDPVVRNRSEEALAWLAANHASVHRRYEFVAALAQSPGKPATNALAEQSRQGGVTEFTVVLRVLVGADGSVKEARVEKPSGNASLDEKALSEALRNWKLEPATEDGKPIEKWGNFSVTYKLTD
jgi:TonB family protein